MKNKFERFDDKFIELINRRMRNKYFDYIMLKITNLGGALFSSLILFILLLFGSRRYKLIGVEMFFALTISQIIVHSLKRILSRERPYKILEQLNTFGINLKDYSFPSGHSAASFSIATTLALNVPKLSALVFIIAIIIGISRIYLGVHYPTDVAAGIVIGFSISLILHLFFLETIYDLGRFINLNWRLIEYSSGISHI